MSKSVTFDLDKVVQAFKEKQQKTPNMDELAAEFGTTKNTLYFWKRGKSLEKVESIMLILDKTGLKFEDIFTTKKRKNGKK